MFLIAGIILFILLIVAHEYGHFLVAKRNGIEVEEFGVFFPPKIWGKKMGRGIFEAYYTINALPLGGFVKLKGETDEDERPGSFGAASFKSKIKVMLAGIFTNYIIGVLLFIVLAFGSLPVVFDDQRVIGGEKVVTNSGVFISETEEGLPADLAGIERSDKIVSVNDQPLDTDSKLLATLLSDNQAKSISIEYEDYSDADKLTSIEIKLLPSETEQGEKQRVFGATFSGGELEEIQSEWWSAPINGFMFANRIFIETFKFIGDAVGSLFTGDPGEAAEDVAGPVGIVNELNNVSSFKALIAITANISLALAVANLLPIPGLDGGKLYTMLIFKALRKKLTQRWETIIYGAGGLILITLIIAITINDIAKL